MKQRVDRARNGRGTFILSRRHWQGKQADLLITFALQLRSPPLSLSLFPPSTSPVFASPFLRPREWSSARSRIRQHACTCIDAYPSVLLMPISQLSSMNGISCSIDNPASYPCRLPADPNYRSMIFSFFFFQPMMIFNELVHRASMTRDLPPPPPR